ncbi:MAG TPA: PDZ domain-containing protein [Kofleriaceae bacterium]|nr:PDZ domain-containing protein [Kofleriaceae bacterium]
MRKRTIVWALVAAVGGITGIVAAAPHAQQPSHSSSASPPAPGAASAGAPDSGAVVLTPGHGRLGFAAVQISPELRTFFGAPADRGVLVQDVRPDRPAARAGLKIGDVILEVDGEPVHSSREIIAAIADRKKGDAVAMQIERGKKRLTLRATLAEDAAAGGTLQSGQLDDGTTWQQFQSGQLGEMPFDLRQMFGDDGATRRELEQTRKRLDELERRLDKLEHH